MFESSRGVIMMFEVFNFSRDGDLGRSSVDDRAS